MACEQQFRCLSRGIPRSEAIIEARFDQRSQKNVIRWESVTQAFPGVIYVLRDGKMVEFECDNDMEELFPRRIAAYPDEIIEVIVADQEPGNNSQTQSTTNDIVTAHQASIQCSTQAYGEDDLTNQVNHLAIVEVDQQDAGSESLEVTPETGPSADGTRTLIDAMQRTANSGLQLFVKSQRNQTKMIIDIMANHHADLSAAIAKGNALQHKLNEKQDHIIELQKEVNMKQDRIIELQNEVKDMNQQALDRLVAIQSQLQAVFTQNYELLEYPIPRLFIILPREPRFRDHFNPFTVPFKLYFLCECGSHTMGESTSAPHKIHIAKHEGYEVDQQTEFLQKYGSYILAVLQMIRYGAALAATVVPAIAMADISEQVNLASESIKHIKENIKDLVDDAISILQLTMESTGPADRADGQSEFCKTEALEGADLRQLDSYLASEDSARTLGNLYRMVTKEGHVKWVCLDHYRENYKEMDRKQLQEIIESSGGELDESEGIVAITLSSRLAARQFYDALQRARRILELDVCLDWDVTLDDLRQLETAVKVSNISILRLEASAFYGPASDVLNRNRRFDPLIDIMTNGRIRSFELKKCPDFFMRISRFPQSGSISSLQSLELSFCDLRTTDDALNLFNALPRVKRIQVVDEGVSVILSRTVGSPDFTDGTVLINHLSVRNIIYAYWERNFDDWFKMKVVHFETDAWILSNHGLDCILSRNQQLETLTVNTVLYRKEPAFLEEVTRALQKAHHPLRLLTLKCKIIESTVSVGYDHGHILSGTLRVPQCRTIELDHNYTSVLNVRIEKQILVWGFSDLDFMYYDVAGILPIFINTFPKLLIQEIECDDLSNPDSISGLCQLLDLSKESLTRLVLMSNNIHWTHQTEDKMKIDLYPNLSSFSYSFSLGYDVHSHSLLPLESIEELIDWILGMLPLKSSQQSRPQKMSVELKNINMEIGSWDRFLNSIDFQSLHEFKLADCVFTEELFTVLKTVLVDAELDLYITNMRNIDFVRTAAFVTCFRHKKVRVKWMP